MEAPGGRCSSPRSRRFQSCRLASEHPLITFVDAPGLDPKMVRDIDANGSDESVAAVLAELCAEMASRVGALRSARPGGETGYAAVS